MAFMSAAVRKMIPLEAGIQCTGCVIKELANKRPVVLDPSPMTRSLFWLQD